MTDLANIHFSDLLPESIRNDAAIAAAAEALDQELQKINALLIQPELFYRIDELDDDVLDHLGSYFRHPFLLLMM